MDVCDSLVTGETERQLEVSQDRLDNRFDAFLTGQRKPVDVAATNCELLSASGTNTITALRARDIRLLSSCQIEAGAGRHLATVYHPATKPSEDREETCHRLRHIPERFSWLRLTITLWSMITYSSQITPRAS